MFQNSHKILLSPIFLSGLFLLLLNDFFLKAEFHNFFTGKLSDFVGLFVFAVFFCAFFPKRKFEIYVLTAISFTFWKLPISQNLIDFLNSFNLLNFGRTVDFSDLAALSVLPLSQYFLIYRKKTSISSSFIFEKNPAMISVCFLSMFAFTATTLVKDRSIEIGPEFETLKSKSEIEYTLKNSENIHNIKIERYSELFPGDPNANLFDKQNTYFVHLDIDYEICESKQVSFSFMITQATKGSKIDPMSAKYECSQYTNNSVDKAQLEKQQQGELENVFEREIGEKLRQSNTQ